MRKVTVSALRRQNGSLYRPTYSAPVPCIRIAGQWLEEAGITPGQKLHIHPMRNGLWITQPAVINEGSAR